MKLADFLSQEQIRPTDFARQIGAPSSTITRFLRGERGISLGVALRIAQRTGGAVTPSDLDRPSAPTSTEASAA